MTVAKAGKMVIILPVLLRTEAVLLLLKKAVDQIHGFVRDLFLPVDVFLRREFERRCVVLSLSARSSGEADMGFYQDLDLGVVSVLADERSITVETL